ncbi:heparinase II/III-family protein [Schleiferiaceae bacterium]|nr:heparinase II/III-family protein [Schleiferiaceae bacterium]
MGDFKYTMEPYRLTWIPLLNIHDNSAKLKVREVLRGLNSGIGPYWIDALEVSIRGLNLMLFLGNNSLDSEIRKEVGQVLKHSVSLVTGNLSLYSSGANHLVGEAAFLFCADLLFDRADVDDAFSRFTTAASNQFMESGFPKEHSICYFKDVLAFILCVRSFSAFFNKESFIEELNRLYKHAFQFYQFWYENAAEFSLGDNDGSFMFGTDQNDESLGIYNVITGKGHPNEKSIYCHFPRFELSVNAFNCTNIRLFKSYKFKLLIDLEEFGFERMNAHSHENFGSVQLSMNNIPVFVDSGTYTYSSKEMNKRVYFRSAQSKNVTSYTNKPFGKPVSDMIWKEPFSKKWFLSGKSSVITVSKLRRGLFLRRFIFIDERVIIIRDDVVGRRRKSEKFISTFMLSPEVNFKNGVLDVLGDQSTIHSSVPIKVKKGLYSPSFGKLQKTSILSLEVENTSILEIRLN